MRAFAWFLLPALCAAGQELVVQGTVTHALTHEPLSGVQVRLLLMKGNDMSSREGFGAQSDRAGHFEVGGIKPGRYVVMPTLRGFVYNPPGGSSDPRNAMISIRAGLNQDLKIEMAPHSVITGRVLDTDGEPVSQVFVQLEPVADPGMGGQVAQSDDRGIFRVVTGPGRYYVKATYYGVMQNEKRTDGSAPFKPAPTYHPASGARDSAVVVEARAGAETPGIDIRMGGLGAASRSYGISGLVTGLPDERDSQRTPYVVLREKRLGGGNTRSMGISPTGGFQFNGLAPGDYDLAATAGDLLSQIRTITISGGDVTGVDLRVLPAITISGRLTVKGDPPGPLREKWKVSLQPADSMFFYQAASRTAEVAADGSFHTTLAPALGVRASLSTPPEGACISSMKVDDAEARVNDPIQLSGRDTSIVLMVSRTCATISGVVKARDGSVLRDAMGMVVLVTDLTRVDFVTNNRWQVPIAADGKFEFKAISPGKYRVVALDTMQSTIRSAEDFVKVAARQKEIEVKDGDRLTLDLNVMTREDVNVKP